jgi:4-amino-4-deoxy-L-arabinose transferase-like glycosyltransferase
MRFPLVLLVSVLVLMRLPSLVEPMGADQSLYAYIGERILHGELPYVDAWDQKPPAVHYTYALMRAIWPSDAVVAAADLVAATAVAVLLFAIGRTIASAPIGEVAAVLFLLLSNPSFTRLNGVRMRAQCEMFIALAVTAAVWILVRHGHAGSRMYLVSGVLFGLAFSFKYNAVVYAAAAFVVLVGAGTMTVRNTGALAAGFGIVPICLLIVLAGALKPLYDATIQYNVQYSGETYTGPAHFVRYLLTFPIERARVDAMWTLGGAGSAILLASGWGHRARLIPVVWVAAACVSVAINGSRGLPQYFVQVGPALAFAAAWGAFVVASTVRRRCAPAVGHAVVAFGLLIVAVAVWRVNQFPKLAEQTWFDTRYMFGKMSRDAYLARYADERKYSAAGAVSVASVMRDRSGPRESVYLFGFTPAAYVYADRKSASRFFWSRPVIAGFMANQPGYGVGGVLADLERAQPAVVALQINDWAPDVDDSAHFFMTTAPLAEWLRAHYTRMANGPEGFDVWLRRE